MAVSLKRAFAQTLLAGVLVSGASADDGGRKNGNNGNNGSFESSLVGSVPQTTVGGVPSGGVPWVVSGATQVSNGQIEASIRGLLITTGPGVNPALVGTVGPVQMVAVSLICGGSGGSVSTSSDGVPLSSHGDAQIEASITIPGNCLAPVVLVRIFNPNALVGSQLGPFIAVTGLTPGNNNGQSNGNNDNDR